MMDTAKATFCRADVVRYYQNESGLQPAEAYLFDKYIAPYSDVIDVGVGGGRTTPYLKKTARSYCGVDYSKPMVDACRERFPGTTFMCSDASDMRDFAEAAFDAVVMSFNGIDYLATDELRKRALREFRRIVRPSGFVILSSHHARNCAILPDYGNADIKLTIWRTAYSVFKSVKIIGRNVFSTHFLSGDGYVNDPVHGGIRTHVSTPTSMAKEADVAGLKVIEAVPWDMKVRPRCFVRWYYYAMRPH